jgi:hypothetical protein
MIYDFGMMMAKLAILPISRPAFIPVRFPLRPLDGPELQLLGAIADAPYGRSWLIPILTAFNQVEQLAELFHF